MVRIVAGGTSIDLDAEVDSQSPIFKRGQRVIVLSYKKGKVEVGPFETGEPRGQRDRRREGAS